MPGNETLSWAKQLNVTQPAVAVAPGATATIDLGDESSSNSYDQYSHFLVTTPASGVGTLKMPPAELTRGRTFTFETLNTGGGEVEIADAAGSDIVGDNLSAGSDDYAVLYSTGKRYIVLKEVTT